MIFETLLYDVEDRVATITLNRPERRNAFDQTMAEELGRAWEEVKRDPEVTCAILTGAGDQALCTGVDVTSIVEAGGFDRNDAPDDAPDDVAPEDSVFSKITSVQNECWKPVITAVNGMVCGTDCTSSRIATSSCARRTRRSSTRTCVSA